jgi:hypothetical protein
VTTIRARRSIYDSATLIGATSTARGSVTVYTDSWTTIWPGFGPDDQGTNGVTPNSNTLAFPRPAGFSGL